MKHTTAGRSHATSALDAGDTVAVLGGAERRPRSASPA